MFAAFTRLRTLLVQRPYIANAALSGAMMLVGDQLAQNAERQARAQDETEETTFARAVPVSRENAVPHAMPIDWARTTTLCSWAAAASCFWTGYYGLLHRRLPGKYALWVVLTAAVPGPVVNAGFFSYSTAMEDLRKGGNLDTAIEAAREKLRTRWLPTVIVSTQMWAALNYANFRFVPNEFRVLFGMTANLFWNFLLSQQQALAPGAKAQMPLFWAPDVHWPKESGSWPRIIMEKEQTSKDAAVESKCESA